MSTDSITHASTYNKSTKTIQNPQQRLESHTVITGRGRWLRASRPEFCQKQWDKGIHCQLQGASQNAPKQGPALPATCRVLGTKQCPGRTPVHMRTLYSAASWRPSLTPLFTAALGAQPGVSPTSSQLGTQRPGHKGSLHVRTNRSYDKFFSDLIL